jgi:hypothetical protein
MIMVAFLQASGTTYLPSSEIASSSDLILIVQTESPFYGSGEVVKIRGNLTDTNGTAIQGAKIAVEVRNPRNNTILLDIVFTSIDGKFVDSFRLDKNALLGDYYVYGTANAIGYPATTSQTTFMVVTGGWELDFAASTRHPIVDFAVYNGSLFAAADNKLYMKEGSSWNVIDAPTFVTSLEPYGDKLVVGGQRGLYCYDGALFDLIFPVPTYIKSLGVYNNRLYAGTMLDNPPKLCYCNGSADNPSDWYVDTDFSAILNFSRAFGSIDSYAVYDGNMYVASGDTVYCFDGTGWSVALSYEYAYAFLDMQVFNGKLYLATRDLNRIPLYVGGTGFSGVIIGFDGENWTTVLGHDYWIYSLEEYDGKLYAGTANRIYTFNGTVWDVSFYSADGAYYAISMMNYDGKIYAGMGNGYIFVDPVPPKTNPETVTVPEFPVATVLAVFMVLTMLAAALTREKRTKRFC